MNNETQAAPLATAAALDDDPLLPALLQGSRRALAQAITLAESQRSDQRARARELLRALQAQASTKKRTKKRAKKSALTRRIGITGAPGAGKSSLIAALCQCLLRRQEGSLAVLASDPAALKGGGAVLADKTRMGAIVAEPRMFIRPSPAGVQQTLATGLQTSILLCEAYGFETLLVESVGAGQAESAIDDYVDCLLLLLAPGSGDGLQGMKRGLIELANMMIITKADGALAKQAQKTLEDYRNAAKSFPSKQPQARTTGQETGQETRQTTRQEKSYLLCSSQDDKQVEALCASLDIFFRKRSPQATRRRRAEQRKNLFLRAFAEGAVERALQGVQTDSLMLRFRNLLGRLEREGAALPEDLAEEWFAALDDENAKDGR